MQEKINVLLLSSWFPSKVNLFSGDFVKRHAKAIALKNNVTIIFVKGDYTIDKVIREEINENNLKIITIYYPKTRYKIFNYFQIFKLYRQEFNILRKIDLVHINISFPIGILAILLKIKKGWKYVLTEHWTGFLEENPTKMNFIRKFLVKNVVANASFILPVSDNLGLVLERYGASDYYVIPNVVDTSVFSPYKITKEKREIKFLHISGLSYQKNIQGILNVSKRLHDEGYKFVLDIGGNGDLQMIEDFVLNNNLGNKINVFGSLLYNEVAERMKSSDCFILFSHFENQPCVINESFSCGLPVIATKVGGISEFFPKNFGILIESGNEDELYEAMKKCINNKIEFAPSEVMFQYAIDNFSEEYIASEFDKVYKKVLGIYD